MNKIWLVTGISSGLGKALTEVIMAKGDFLIGSFRNPAQTNEFNSLHGNKAFAVTMDIAQPAQVQAAVDTILQKFGKMDVLVNNAGYGFAGAVEETVDAEVRSVFNTNFFGTLQLTQALLPTFRKQGSGHIIQKSSHGGFKAFAGFGIYNASKFALEGMSEALAQEVAPLGIKLTIVQPGPFRTGFAGSSFVLAKHEIDDYKPTAGLFRERIKGVDGKQEGDPAKAAQAIYDIVQLPQPPLRLPLGKVALGTITSKLESVQNDLNTYRHIAESVVF
jgi:NAD(P)-dependent dehydrogenase (short-subunit alcohol dehydrogenase family)